MNFAYPLWFVLLLGLPLLAAAAVLTARLRLKQWSAFVAPRLRASLLKSSHPLGRWLAMAMLLAACAALIAALARPQGNSGTRTETTVGRNVMIALDLSRSMRVADVKPDRLSQAKIAIYELLDAMPNERIGLIGFAGSADSYAPLTIDHAAVRETVEQIDESWAPIGGSNLSAAVELAIKTLRETGQKNNALVIFSDGEKHENRTRLSELASAANRAGVYIVTIGVGTEDGDYVPNKDFPDGRMVDRNGNQVISRLQTDPLRELAEETNGRFVIAGSGADVVSIVKTITNDLDVFEVEGRDRIIVTELYQWLTLPAIVLLAGAILAATNWKPMSASAAITGFLVLTLAPARADQVSEAKRAYQSGNYARAAQLYRQLAESSRNSGRSARYRLGEASAAYQEGNLKKARAAFSDALASPDKEVAQAAQLGAANTMFQLGWRSLSGETYPQSANDLPAPEQFDQLVLGLLGNEEDSGTSKLKAVIKDWSDAVRHFDSVLAKSPDHEVAKQNRELAITFLNRIKDLLKQEQEQAQQAMPQEQEGEGQPQEGDGEPKQEGNGGKGEEPKTPGKQGDNSEQPEDPGADGEEDQDESPPGPKPAEESKESEEDGDSDESPEERARRRLKENADVERGPLSPGRFELNEPDKDW